MADTQLPLLGVILCCTSIPPEQRSEIAAIACQMGAVHKLDLTSDVTHLIVGETDTPKYKFVAKERPDVKCVLASWIEAVRASWLEGGETDVEELERVHKLPTFTGLKLCVTGFDDLVYRQELEDAIMNNGGEYTGNLTKDVTHLVAKEPTGAKYNYALQWGMKIVAVEWVVQCLERGMILDESLFHLSIPPEQRGKDAWIRRSVSTTSLGKRTRDEDIIAPNIRKLRRTASARLSSQNVGFWSELVGAPLIAPEIKANSWDDGVKKEESSAAAPVIGRLQNKTAASDSVDESATFKHSNPEADLQSLLPASIEKKGLLHGKTMLLRGFDDRQTAILERHLRSHDADIVDDNSGLRPQNSFIVVPFTTSASEASLYAKGDVVATVVTDFWVERCIFQKRDEDPGAHVLNTPFPKFLLKGFEDMTICSTGFQGTELLHTSKVVKQMGATYNEDFTPASSVLVCRTVTPGHEKLHHAQLWAVPAVSATWLWDSITKGELMPFGPYLVQPLRDPNRRSETTQSVEQLNTSSKAAKPHTTKRQSSEAPITKPEKRPPLPRERDVVRSCDKPMYIQKEKLGDAFDTAPLSKPSTKLFTKPSTKALRPDESQNLPIYLDEDDAPATFESIPDNDDDSSNTLTAASASAPLREITPNSSPPKPLHNPTKDPSPLKTKDPPSAPIQQSHPPSASEDSFLGPAISSLLAHHQRANANPRPPSDSSDQPRMYRRRKRQLLGRAPSNLSSHSHNNGLNLSRASSVDTLNTDGLGTPLELSNTNHNNNKPNNENNIPTTTTTTTDFPHIYSASNEDDPDRIDQPLQQTQLGYEDPDVAAWRERVAIKMSGGKVKSPKAGMTPGKSRSAKAREESGKGGLGIAKRTRLASGR